MPFDERLELFEFERVGRQGASGLTAGAFRGSDFVSLVFVWIGGIRGGGRVETAQMKERLYEPFSWVMHDRRPAILHSVELSLRSLEDGLIA